MNDSLSSLTQTELLALALEASKRDDTGHSLAYLKEAAARPDASAHALFMLGSEYAQLGLVADAKAHMARSVAKEPTFWLARFQLGMLHLTTGEPDAAKAVWDSLSSLDKDHPEAYLAAFHRGMVHLVADEFDDALQALAEGIQLNRVNEPLNVDVRRIVDAIQHLPGRNAPVSDALPAEAVAVATTMTPPVADSPQGEADQEPSHLFINAYTHRGKPH